MHRGDATRNSTGNAGVTTKKATTKLSRTASDTRRAQEAEVPLRAQTRMVQQARAFVAARANNNAKKDQRQQQRRQTNAVNNAIKPSSDIMQKSGINEKEVDIVYNGRQLNRSSKSFGERAERMRVRERWSREISQ